MGKKGGTSWLTAVKRAFRSPTKDSPEKVRNCRRKEDHHDPAASSEDQNDGKRREKKRWLFKKSTNPQESVSTLAVQQGSHGGATTGSTGEQTHAIAVAVATAAQAAIEVARISRPTSRGNYAAIVIQTAFRGYLARRALRALKGLVKLQAFVRGYNVRKQAKMTLKCMQALVRVQARVLDERMRLSHEGSRKSTFSDTSSLLESRYLQDIAERRSLSHSREPSSIADDWDERPHTIEEVKAMLQARKEVALKQIWRSDRSSVGEEELEEKPRWLDWWMASKQWDSSKITPFRTLKSRVSTDHRDSIKTVEMDTSYLSPNFRRSITSLSQYQSPYNNQRPASPQHSRANQYQSNQQQPVTPSPARTRPIQIRSASPRSIREDRGYSSSVAQTPCLRSNYYSNNGNLQENHRVTAISSGVPVPNYMTSTESAKARLRSQSAPRHSLSTPEQERGGPKKRLSFPNPPSDSCSELGYVGHANLRSPSFKSAVPMGLGIGIGIGKGMTEKQSNYSSCSDSLGGEISPSSSTNLRRWLS